MQSARRTGIALLLAVLLLAGAWLALWPVPVAPVAWQAPQNSGYVDPYAPNDRLAATVSLALGDATGPDDAALGNDGYLYVSTGEGDILRLSPTGGGLATYAHVGGRPLGIEFDTTGRLWIANAISGLQRVDPPGIVHDLLAAVGDSAIAYANDVAVAADGRVYLTDSTTRFSPARDGGTMAAAMLDILEHGSTGRVIEYDPGAGTARIVADGIEFANGIAVTADQRSLLVAETGHYRVWRYPRTHGGLGARQRVVDNLPGFPDNLNNGLQDRIWVGLVAPRSAALDAWSDQPFLRKAALRLPAFLRPRAPAASHVVAITPDGQVLMYLQDTAAAMPAVTGVLESRDALYLTSNLGSRLGRLDKQALGRD